MQEHSRMMVEAMPSALLLINRTGEIVLLNRAAEKLFGYEREQLLGKPFDCLVPPAFRGPHKLMVAGFLAAPRTRLMGEGKELTGLRNDGTEVPLEIGLSPFRSRDEIFILASIVDVTKRKLAEQQLRKTNTELAKSHQALETALAELRSSHEKLKAAQLDLIHAAKLESIGTLAAGVAHEVKNPLQTLLMGLSFIQKSLPQGNPNLNQVLEDMNYAISRADGIVKELLHFSAVSKFEAKEQEVNPVIERSLWLLNHEINSTGTSVVQGLAPDLPKARLDTGKLEQVLINLLLNALQALGQGGRLCVRSRAATLQTELPGGEWLMSRFVPGEKFVILEVEDNGPGIPEHYLPKIFDPFFTTKPVGQGTGLGLSVVKRIIDLHKGAINVRNIKPSGVLVTVALKTGQSISELAGPKECFPH